jgi:hypothetical protein
MGRFTEKIEDVVGADGPKERATEDDSGVGLMSVPDDLYK